MMNQEMINNLNNQFQDATPEELLSYFLTLYRGDIALASSLSLEDQVLTHMIANIDKFTKIFTLDTGRLFPETYSLIARTEMNYGLKIKIYFPNYKSVERMCNTNGINLFYDSIENRKLCCEIRKIEPLRRAFKGLKVWICGLRKEQSITRHESRLIEWDRANKLLKINPLIGWTEQQVWDYIHANAIPYNKLHEQGFPSIGCQPCTRAVEKGEDIRAGRWWWESPEHRECGLHKHKK
ncbi:MAG: phosphoadenylyl-sulfate reductase [Marinifilaceae bacterium]